MAKILDERFPKILNLDSSPRLLKEYEAFLIKNLRFNSNENVPTGTQGSNAGALTPFQSTRLVCVTDILPTDGDNQNIGTYECKKTNELYYFNYNSSGNHGVYRVDNDGCTEVYVGACLNFSNEEKHAIAEHRVHLAVVSDTDDLINNNIFKKFLIFTDGLNPIRFIDVETSIATDSFDPIQFPYYKALYPFCDDCEYIELPTRPPYDCPKVELVDFNEADANLPNNILYQTFQFRYRYILTDSRVTSWSPISPLSYVPLSNCESGSGAPRCFKLTLNAGSPQAEKIQIAFRTCGQKKGNDQNDIGVFVPSVWKVYDTIDKYDSCSDDSPAINFWERNIILHNYCVPDDDCAQATATINFVDFPIDGDTFTIHYPAEGINPAFDVVFTFKDTPVDPNFDIGIFGDLNTQGFAFAQVVGTYVQINTPGLFLTGDPPIPQSQQVFNAVACEVFDGTLGNDIQLSWSNSDIFDVSSSLNLSRGEGTECCTDSPNVCSCSGTFTETTYTWHFDFSPSVFPIAGVEVIVDGAPYTITQEINDLEELSQLLNTINQGEFLISGTDIYLVEAEDKVYGDMTLNTDASPAIIITPEITEEVITCEANTFDYYFCNDRQCIALDQKETDQDYDDVPRKAWALTPINNKIATGNNLKGFNPINCEELDKFRFGFEFGTELCPVKYHKISGYILVHNPFTQCNEPLHSGVGIGNANINRVTFGGLSTNGDYQDGVADDYGTGYGQYIHGLLAINNDVQKNGTGFIVYVNNKYYTRTVQKIYSAQIFPHVFIADAGLPPNNTLTERKNIMGQITDSNRFYAQYFELIVPDGDYVLRIASHDALTTDDFEKTSTYVFGVLPFGTPYDPTGFTPFAPLDYTIQKEMVITVCGGDIEINNTIGTPMIADLTHPGDLTDKTFVLFGYVTDANNSPVELCSLGFDDSPTNPADQFSLYTDHNGFYFAAWDVGAFPTNSTPTFSVSYDTHSNWVGYNAFVVTSYPNEADQHDVVIVDTNNPDPTHPYADCGYAIFKGKVTNDFGIALMGIAVTVTHSQTVYTLSDGTFEIALHAFVDNGVTGDDMRGINHDSADQFVLSQNGVCIMQDIDDCTACIYLGDLHDYDNSDFDCFDPDRTFDIGTLAFKIANENNKGVKSGQKRFLGIKFHDKNKRHTFIQHRDHYDLQIPFITNYPFNQPPSLFWQLIAQPVIPPEFQNAFMSVYITTNPIEFWLQWIVSSVQFLTADNTVLPSNVNAAKIKFFVRGLNNYNTNNNFQTNTIFEFEAGDRVKFIDDGDNNLFNAEIIDLLVTGEGLVNTPINLPAPDASNNPALPDNTVQSFIVDFDARLADIKMGAWIESYRPSICEGIESFYETCQTYPIVNGVIQVDCADVELNTHYTINFFDTYFVNRAIPQNDASGVPNIFTPTHPFEHHSPSDFWGNHCASLGRPNVINPYEKEVWQSNAIQYSNTLNTDNGFINGLSTFMIGNGKNFEDQTGIGGDIIALKAAIDEMFALTEHSWFTFGVADNVVRVRGDGTLTTAGVDYFGKANQNKAASYGCQYEFPRTVLFFEGLVFWIDATERTPVLCDWGSAVNVNTNTIGYWNDKLDFVEKWNQNNADKYRVHCVVDRANNNIYVTIVKRNNPDQWFINNETVYGKSKNETLVYDYKTKAWVSTPSFIPESYGHLATQIFSFVNGIAWIHNAKDTLTYNTFYGVKCLRAIGLPFNISDSVIKAYLNLSIECLQHSFRADPIVTDTPNQQTYIPANIFEKKENVWYAAIPCDINSPFPNGLMPLADGETMRGHYLSVVLVGDHNFDDVYAEIYRIFVYSFASYLSVQK